MNLINLISHPHVAVVHFPIALTGAALFFILLVLWKKSRIMEQAAFANICLAAASTIVAAVFGIRDNIAYWNGTAPNHVTKIILGVTLFTITAVMAIARWRNKELFYNKSTKVIFIAAYFVSFAIAGVLGYLGGVIVYG
jgi:uncharacterized membrane protein